MICLSQQPNAVAPETHDRRHQSQLVPLRFEDRALLDVQLEVRLDVVDPAGTSDEIEVESCGRHCGAKGDATRIAPRAQCGHVVTGEGAAAEECGAEAGSFLVHEGADPEWSSGLEALPLEQCDGVHGGHHSQRSVQATAGGNRVQVGADEHRLARSGVPVAEQVPGRIDFGRETKSPKPRGNPVIGSEEIRRPREPRDAATLRAADHCKLVEARGDRARKLRHGRERALAI